MSMNVYIKFADLEASLKYIHVTVESDMDPVPPVLDDEDEDVSKPTLSVSVTVTKPSYGSVVGDLHIGGDNLVMFSRIATGAIIEICTKVGIPFKYF